jgi:NhaP-type Na+/H+ or K+/H+ antiporter
VATAIGIIIVCGLLVNYLFVKMKMPGILGMILLGILLGPDGLNWLSPDILRVSADFRRIALVIILLRAGLDLRRDKLNMAGSTVVKLSFIPCLIEGFTIAFAATALLGFSFVEGGILGFIVAAVSPAVVVPRMLEFSRKGIGTDKAIPTSILAGSSIDAVFAVTVLTSFLGIYSADSFNIPFQIFNGFMSIIFGITLGLLAGYLMVRFFIRYNMRDTKKVLYVLGGAILLLAVEDILKSKIQVAGLLGIMTVGFIILEKIPKTAKRLASKFSKIWIFAEIFLFVLVGAQVNIGVIFGALFAGIIIIAAGLAGRSAGVIFSTAGTNLNYRERLFCVISYLPKATVQAAVGAIPLTLGIPEGELILAIAVLSIVITAPLGAIGISYSARRLLTTENKKVKE